MIVKFVSPHVFQVKYVFVQVHSVTTSGEYLCDVVTLDGSNVAKEMLRAGLASYDWPDPLERTQVVS